MYKGDLIEVTKTITSDEMRSFNKDPDLLVKPTIQDINSDIIKELTKYINVSQSYQPNNDLILTGSFNLINDFEVLKYSNDEYLSYGFNDYDDKDKVTIHCLTKNADEILRLINKNIEYIDLEQTKE